MEVEQNVHVKEEGYLVIKEEADIGIKQEDIPEDKTFPDIKTEPNGVSYVCVSFIMHILPVSRNFSCFVMLIFLAN